MDRWKDINRFQLSGWGENNHETSGKRSAIYLHGLRGVDFAIKTHILYRLEVTSDILGCTMYIGGGHVDMKGVLLASEKE